MTRARYVLRGSYVECARAVSISSPREPRTIDHSLARGAKRTRGTLPRALRSSASLTIAIQMTHCEVIE